MAGDLVWTADINADAFVQSTNRMRADAKRTRDEVQKSFQDMFFANSNQVAQRESAQRARAAEIAAPSNNFFAASASMATQDQIEKEQRLAMAQAVRFQAEQHHEKQRLAMRARADAAYEQQIADERRLAQQKAVQAAADGRMDRVVKLAMEQTYRQKAINLVLAEEAAEKKLAATRQLSSRAVVAGSPLNRTNRIGLIGQQLAYGIEDAATQFGTMGLAGAFRAASNNLSAAGAVMGTTTGILISLGAAAATVALQFSGMEEEQRKITLHAEGLAKSWDRQREAARKLAEWRVELNEISSKEEVDSRKKAIEKDIAGTVEELKVAKLQAEAYGKFIAGLNKERHARDAAFGGFGKYNPTNLFYGASEEQERQMQKYEEKVRELVHRKFRSDKELEDLNKIRPQAAMKEYDKKELQQRQSAETAENQQRISRVKQFYESTRTAAEKYQQTLKEIEELKDFGLDPETAKRAAEKARMDMQQEMDKGIRAEVHLTPYVDARSAEALNNYYKHLLTGSRDMPSNSLPTAQAAANGGKSDWELSQEAAKKHQEKMVVLTEKLVRLTERQDPTNPAKVNIGENIATF